MINIITFSTGGPLGTEWPLPYCQGQSGEYLRLVKI